MWFKILNDEPEYFKKYAENISALCTSYNSIDLRNLKKLRIGFVGSLTEEGDKFDSLKGSINLREFARITRRKGKNLWRDLQKVMINLYRLLEDALFTKDIPM